MNQAAVQLGALTLGTPVMLAPMAGVTNPPFRQLCREQGEAIRTLKKDNRELEEQLKDASEIIRELEAVKNDEIDGLKADLEHAMVYLEGHQGREQKLKKIIRDITSDYLDILSDKDRVIEELNQLVKDLS